MRRTGTNRFVLLVPILTFLNIASSDSKFSDVEANAEVDDAEGIVNEGFPSGSERDRIEYYCNRGLTFRQITLMLGKHHHLDMNEQRLEDGMLWMMNLSIA